ncbi:MAG: flavodoxin family protein [Deltaproteobacteria bacterium]|jgi:multimeric flavodoxin WrbA|nr:flavodoxin family protein [Deltaproteobacteria bacterium]
MNVVVINGSPRANGNTAFALTTAAKVLEEKGIRIERIDIGQVPIHGCIACRSCMQQQNRQCRIADDPVNGWLQTMIEADGMVIGSPVYYGGMNGALKAFLDRAFFTASGNGGLFRHKVGAGVVAVRRAGSVATLDQLNKYFSISEMFIPGSNYWNEMHGLMPGEAAGDAEGVQCMRVLGANMAWLLHLIEHGKHAVPAPVREEKIRTNFIR